MKNGSDVLRSKIDGGEWEPQFLREGSLISKRMPHVLIWRNSKWHFGLKHLFHVSSLPAVHSHHPMASDGLPPDAPPLLIMEETMLVPPWLEPLLSSTFFDVCRVHGDLRGTNATRNSWDVKPFLSKSMLMQHRCFPIYYTSAMDGIAIRDCHKRLLKKTPFNILANISESQAELVDVIMSNYNPNGEWEVDHIDSKRP